MTYNSTDAVMVSVVCNAYNHEAFIRDALDGFIMQKARFPFEVLVHDDASTDGTTAIIKEYASKHPDLIFPMLQAENQHSKGVRVLRSIQLQRARGKYIAVCEGDDYWTDPDKLQIQVDFLEKNQEYALCFHSARTLATVNADLYQGRFESLGDRDYTGEEILRKWVIPMGSIMFRREYIPFLQPRPIDSNYFFYDINLFLRLADQGKLRCFDKPMSVYRIHGKGMHQTANSKNYTLFYRHYQAISNDFNGKYKVVMLPFLTETALLISRTLLKKGQPLEAMKYFARFLKDLSLAFFYEPRRVLRRMAGKRELSSIANNIYA